MHDDVMPKSPIASIAGIASMEMLPRLAVVLVHCKPCLEPILKVASNFHG
jgi:hypothetical protein